MLETVVEQLLLHCLDPYVDGISKDKLHLGVFNGSVELLDLRVKPEALALLGFEGFRVRSGSIRIIKAAVPWSKIYHAKVRITVEAVHLEVEQIGLTEERSQADLFEEVREAKRKAIDLRVRELRDLLEQQREHIEAAQAGQRRGVGVKALRKVLNNIQATLSDVRVSFINNHRGLACGFELPELRILSTDQTFRERADTEEVVVSGLSMYKLLKLRGLGVRMSSAGSSSLAGAEYVLTPISADLQLAQVPSDQILRLRLEIATKEIAELTMHRSQVKHLRSVQASSVAEAARLHALLVPPEEEVAIYDDPAAAKVEYGQLYERRLLHEWHLAAASDRPLSPDEAKRLQLLEDALSIRLLARQRWSVRSKVEALNVEVTRRQREAEERARLEEQNSAGFMSRFAGYWSGADTAPLPEVTNGDKASGSTWLSEEERDQLLRDLNDNSKVETVDLPQRLKFEFVLGKVSLDLIDDRFTDPVRMQLLRVDLQDVIWEVHVDMLPDHLGRDSAEWRVECSLSTFRALHAAKNVCRLCPPVPRQDSDVSDATDRERGVSWLDRVSSTKLVLENKLEPNQNLLKCRFEFAPLEVHLLRGALEKLLELFARSDADEVYLSLAGNDAGGDRGMSFEEVVDISRELLEVHGDRAREVAERVYEQIPDRMHLEVRIASPIIHVPVAGLGNATFSLGHLELITPEPCAYSNIDLAVNLTHTSLRAVSTRGERFNMIEPIPIHLRVEYRGAEQENSLDISVTVQEVTLSLAPQALQILVATPSAVSSIMAETEAVFPSEAADACNASSTSAPVAAPNGDASALAATSLTQRASDFVREVLGEDSAAKAANLLQVAEEKAKQFRFNLNMQLDALDVIFADSIVPVMRLHLEMLPPGLVLYQQTVPPALSLDISTGTLEVEILNTRNGAWEPLMERFCLGLQLVRTPEGEDETVTHIIVSGHEPLLINLSPTALKRACWILPLFLSSLSRDTPQPGAANGDTGGLGSGSANAMKYRVVNLCDHPLDLAFKCRNNDGFSMQIQPTGSLWEPLDDWVLPHFATALTANVPKGEASDLLLLERAGAVLIPDSGAVAEMIAPSPSHRLLLLASPLRLHNQTDLTLLIRFHDAVQREVLLVHVPDTSACDAALLGYDLPDYAVHSQFKNGAAAEVDIGSLSKDSEDSVLILGPNAYCAVPAVAVVRARGIAVNNAHTWLSIKPAVIDADFCSASKAGASVDPQMVCCRGNGGTRDGLRDVHLILESSTYLAHPSAPMSLTTIAVRPALALLNALPVGNLSVSYAARAREQAQPAIWHEAHVPRFHCLNVYSFPDALEEGISISARLEEDAPWSAVVDFRREEFEETGDVVRALQLCQSEGGAAACIVVEPRRRAELRISSPYWLADRSGMNRPLAIELRRKGRQLPCADGITLLPADCFEESCELLLRSACSSFATQLVRMPPSWCTLPWQTPCGSFVFCVQTDDVASCDVLGARCQVMTLRPRLVLTNASDLDIELWDARSRNLRLTAGQSLEWHWQVQAGDEDSPSTGMLFRPLSAAQYKWSGAVVCSDTTAGSTPFLLSRAPSADATAGAEATSESDAALSQNGSCSGHVTVWSVEVAPIRGALAVSFRQGSDFVAVNRVVRAQLSMVIRPLSGGNEGGTISIPVPQGREVPYGWSRPFQGIGGLSRAVDVWVRGTTVRTGEEPIQATLRIMDVRRTTRRVLHQFGVAVAVTRVGTQTLLTLEDHEAWQDMSPRTRAQAETGGGSSWLSRIEVKLSSLGISLVQELPQPRELLYCHLDVVRLEWRQNDDDVQQLTLVITEAQVDCQLPGRVESRTTEVQRRESVSLLQRERPTVIFANCASGDRAFLSLFLQRSATSSRDLVLPCVDIALDALDVAIDDGWLDPLVGFLKQASPEDPTGGGLPFTHVMQTAGRPIAEGYKPPMLPRVIQVDGLQMSSIQLTVWCSLRLATVRFLPAYVRTAIRVLSLSGKLTLDGATLSLEPRTLTAHRGSLSDFSDSLARLYAVNLLNNAAAVLGKSSVLNVTRVPLKFGGTAVSFVTESVGVAAGEAAALLSRLTFDREYVRRQRQIHGEKDIRGISDGVVEAGKSLAQGVDGLFDVVRKPVQGATSNGFGGFLAGVGRGVAGTFVKPISKVGQAIADVGSGIAATVAPKRRRARIRQRQPRLLFSELGEIRPWCPLDAELLRQLDRRLTSGVECVVPLTQNADASAKRLVLMLFAKRLVVAEVKMPREPVLGMQAATLPRRSSSGSSVNGTGQKSSELAQKDGWVDALDDSVHKVLLQVQKPIKSLVCGVQDIERQLAGSSSTIDVEVAAEPQLSRRARELSFDELAAVHNGEDGGILQLEDTHGNTMEIPLYAAPMGDLARRALLSGFRSAVDNAGGIADWTGFRTALRKERHRAERRGLRAAPWQAATIRELRANAAASSSPGVVATSPGKSSRTGGSSHHSGTPTSSGQGGSSSSTSGSPPSPKHVGVGQRILEVFEVERWSPAAGKWATPFLPGDQGLSWRWVDATGSRHPHLDPSFAHQEIVSKRQPPCKLNALFHLISDWVVDVHDGTDEDGWRYGIAWNASTWDSKPGLIDALRRRRWTRTYS